MSRGLLRRLTILLLDLFYLAVFVSGAPIVASKAPAMPPSLPGSSFVWMLALWALSPRNIRLVSAVPSTVVVDNQDPRIQYTPAEQWSVPLFNVAPRPFAHPLPGFGTPPTTGGAISTMDRTPGPTAPRQHSASQVAPIT